jgi:hypothetical protein
VISAASAFDQETEGNAQPKKGEIPQAAERQNEGHGSARQ